MEIPLNVGVFLLNDQFMEQNTLSEVNYSRVLVHFWCNTLLWVIKTIKLVSQLSKLALTGFFTNLGLKYI